MRYYCFSMNADQDSIKSNSKVRLNDYIYDDPVASVNSYMAKNVENHIAFFIFNVTDGKCLSAFAYNEQKVSFKDAFDNICSLLGSVFGVKTHTDPREITMHEFMDFMNESRRHDFMQGLFHKIADISNLWIYNLSTDEERALPYSMEEHIAPSRPRCLPIYDGSFRREMTNISKHKPEKPSDVNIVHYTISGNSRRAEYDLADALAGRLYSCRRLTGRRIVFLSDIKPDIYEKYNYFERIIENNYGGTVVIDLTEKFGYRPSQYVAAAKFIEQIFIRHCAHCLFIFLYGLSDPGYSFYLLPQIQKYVITVPLCEGSGGRKSACGYLKHLIGRSDAASYADEFMEQLEGDSFTQTDIIEAYGRFTPWYMNKTMKSGYSAPPSGDFSLDRSCGKESCADKLDSLIGLDLVKKQIADVIATDIVGKERRKHQGRNCPSVSSHMIFAGNPGTAKTTVAKLFSGIAREKGILKSGVFVERGGMDLDDRTPLCVYHIRDAFTAAKGGVLFIDEAYSIVTDMAVTTLIQEMENRRDSVIVILAGYAEKMQEFLERNDGLKSRIPHWIDFPDYTTDELTSVFKLMLGQQNMTADEAAVNAASMLFDRMRLIDNFGNGRYVRNVIQRAMQNQSSRLLERYHSAALIPAGELCNLTADDISSLNDGTVAARVSGTARAELDSMIGLSSVKETIGKAVAKFKLDKLCSDRGITRNRGAMHMVFTGNPGTAKTTVARLCAEIFADEKILPTGNFVEAGRADLVGDHVGETAKLVKKKFCQAQGGVLFIDEAYSLCDSHEGSFGDEAINTIVQEMENHREETIVIFAGYPAPMKDFLDRNPGMRSRIAFHVEFPDYSADELCRITELMLSGKHMVITDEAMDKLRVNYESIGSGTDFGNGRYVRKLLDEAEMNLAKRIMDLKSSELTDALITTIDASDIPEMRPPTEVRRRFGFAG